MSKYRTTAAYISGGICGHMWWPQSMGGKLFKQDARGPWGFMDRFSEPASFEDALLSILTRDGGDFQNAQFTADTVIRVERRRIDARGRYTVHCRSIALADLVPDLVNSEFYTGDFMSS